MKSKLLSLLVALILFACFDQVSSTGGGSQGVALVISDTLCQNRWGIRVFAPQSNQVNFLDTGMTFTNGDIIKLPDSSGIELRNSDGKHIIFIPLRSWKGVSNYYIGAKLLDSLSQRILWVDSIQSLGIFATPYQAKGGAGLWTLNNIPSQLRQIVIQTNSKQSFYNLIRDSIQQHIYIPSPQAHSLWNSGVPTTLYADFSQSKFIVNQDSSQNFLVSMDTSVHYIQNARAIGPKSFFRIKHLLPITSGDSLVRQYTYIMDVYFNKNSNLFFNAFFNVDTSVNQDYLLSLDINGKLRSDQYPNGMGAFNFVYGQWIRLAIVVNLLNTNEIQVWANGQRMADFPQAPFFPWTRNDPDNQGNFYIYQDSLHSGVIDPFVSTPNSAPNLLVRRIAIYPGVLSDSLLAQLGVVQ